MDKITDIKSMVISLGNKISRNDVNVKMCNKLIDTILNRLNEISDELLSKERGMSKKQRKIEILSRKVADFKPLKESLDSLTSHNGRLLKKIKRMENKKH